MKCKKCKTMINKSHNFCPVCGRETKPLPKAKPRRPKGSGSVYKLAGNRSKPYVAMRHKVCLETFATENEASLFLLNSQDYREIILAKLTLEELYERWTDTEWYNALSNDAKASYKAAWGRLSMHAKERVSDLKTSHYQMVIELIKEQGFQRDTCEKARSLISNLCKFAMQDDIIDKNYADGLMLPAKTHTQKRNFTDEEILTLFYNDEDRDARIVLCLIYSGLRESELFKMEKENVYLEKRYMKGGSKTTAGKERIIPIRNEIIKYITEFYETPSNSKYLIPSPLGTKYDRSNFIKRNFYPLLDRLKINYKDEEGNNILTPHRTRHTFVEGNIKAGVKPEVLTKIVGHSNFSTTVDKYDKYTDVDYIVKEAQKGL